jgi:hypothetical protein
MSLNVMVLESDPGAAEKAIHALTDAGHVVLRCHDPGAPAFPCRGLIEPSDCPLRSHAVDVAVTVRARHRSEPTTSEGGVTCALMHRIPLVVVGPRVPDPYERRETRVLDGTVDVVRACEDVAAGEMAEHSRVATAALRASRTPSDALERARAAVTRRNGRLLATISGFGALAPRQRDAAIVRVLGKLREFDPFTKGIDVVVEGQPAPVTETCHST